MLITIKSPYYDGEYVEAESALLSSPDSAYGIRRSDTLAVVVANDTAMAFDGIDSYTYNFDDAVENAPYELWIEIVFDGETYRYHREFTFDEVPFVKTISFVIYKDGERIEPDSGYLPELASPGSTYGVKRLSDGEIMLEAFTQMALVGNAVYKRGFEALDDNESYKFYVTCEVGGVLYSVASTTKKVSSAMLAIGRYTDSTRIAERFGVDNLHLWLCAAADDLEEPVDYAKRAWQFIDEAEKEIDRRVRGSFVNEEYGLDDADVPNIISKIATELAGIKMYEWRGVDDVDPETNERQHRLRAEKRECDRLIRQIAMGEIREARLTSPITHPLSGGGTVGYVNDGA